MHTSFFGIRIAVWRALERSTLACQRGALKPSAKMLFCLFSFGSRRPLLDVPRAPELGQPWLRLASPVQGRAAGQVCTYTFSASGFTWRCLSCELAWTPGWRCTASRLGRAGKRLLLEHLQRERFSSTRRPRASLSLRRRVYGQAARNVDHVFAEQSSFAVCSVPVFRRACTPKQQVCHRVSFSPVGV